MLYNFPEAGKTWSQTGELLCGSEMFSIPGGSLDRNVSFQVNRELTLASLGFDDETFPRLGLQRNAIGLFIPNGLNTSVPLLPQILHTVGYKANIFSKESL